MNNSLLGRWQLESWTISYEGSDRVIKPFGSKPQGMITYTPGWMNAAIAVNDREPFPEGTALRSLAPEQLAKAYTSYFHYAGPYRIEGDTVIHSVVMSLNPNFVGTEQVRKMQFDGNYLTLSGEETIKGQRRLNTLCWQRVPESL